MNPATTIGIVLAVWLLLSIITVWIFARIARARISRMLGHPATTTVREPENLGAWEYRCGCQKCVEAPQPSVTICPQGHAWGHVIPRDQFAHNTDGECVCGPEEALTVAGPFYLHTRVSAA